MIAHIVEGGNTVGLMVYLAGPGRANEHEAQHLVAGDDIMTGMSCPLRKPSTSRT